MIDSSRLNSSEQNRERSRDKEVKEEDMTDKSEKEKGIIKSLNTGGFGFIIAADGEKELFFHRSSMVKQGTFQLLRERDEVLYKIGWDTQKDKEMAIEIDFLVNTHTSIGKTGGRVFRLDPKGFGFIQPHSSAERIYFHSTCMSAGQRFEMLREGDEVEYDEGFDEKVGKPQANNVRSCRTRDRGIERDGMYGLMPQRGGMNNHALLRDEFRSSQPMFGRPGSAYGFDSGQMAMGLLIGIVDSKNEKGFGFIRPVHGSESIYFHRTSLQRFEGWNEIDEGDKVSFIMGWDKKNGKQMAEGVRLLSKGIPENSTEGWYGKVTGRIMSLNEKGFGFLSTGQETIYFHSTSLFQVTMDDLNVGDDVVFIKGWDSKNNKQMAKQVELRYNNRFQGQNEELGFEVRMGQEADNQTRTRTGHIIRVSDKGFGFIKPDDSEDSIYFHRTSLANPEGFSEFKESNAVVFENGWDRKNGKPMATNVQLQ